MKRAALYSRVSSVQQADTGTSLATQTDQCRKYAEAHGFTVVREVQEDLSGATLNRPGLDTLRDMAACKEIEAMIVYDPDRLSRTLSHLLIVVEEFEQAGVALLFVNAPHDGSPESTMLLQMRGMFAQYEKTKIQERVRRGKERALSDGRILSRMAPYGYTKQGPTFAINPDEAPIIQEIFALMATGRHTLYSIAMLMRERGYPNKRGGHWYVSTIQRILNNETYAGTYHAALATWKDGKRLSARPRDEWIPISVPPIVSRATFERANTCIWQNKKYANRNSRHPHLLTGFLSCAECGGLYKSWASESEAHRTYRYYTCPMRTNYYRIKGQPKCTNSALKGIYLDDEVWRVIVRSLTDVPYTEEAVSITKDDPHLPHQHAMRASVAALERLDREEAALIAAYRRDILTIDQLQTQITDIRHKRAQEQERKQEAEGALSRMTVATEEELSAIETLRDRIAEAPYTLEEKRTILKLLRFQGTVKGDTITITMLSSPRPITMTVKPPTLVIPRLSK